MVDPRVDFARRIEDVCAPIAEVGSISDFLLARRTLLESPPDLLVTNVRLDAYNGLHLIYLSMAMNAATRSIVYSAEVDLSLIEEVQRIGAFYELEDQLPYNLPRYLTAMLPELDRRSALSIDRRAIFRGGRRATDLAVNVV